MADTPVVGEIQHPYKPRDQFWQDRNGSPYAGDDHNDGGMIPATGNAGKQPMPEIDGD